MKQNSRKPKKTDLAIRSLAKQVIRCTLVRQTLRECGYQPVSFEFNDDMEVYYDIETSKGHDIGCISKGWTEPGYRIANIITVPRPWIIAQKAKVPGLMQYCATRGFALTAADPIGEVIEFSVETVIYSAGFNDQVLAQVLENLTDCNAHIRSTLALPGREKKWN